MAELVDAGQVAMAGVDGLADVGTATNEQSCYIDFSGFDSGVERRYAASGSSTAVPLPKTLIAPFEVATFAMSMRSLAWAGIGKSKSDHEALWVRFYLR